MFPYMIYRYALLINLDSNNHVLTFSMNLIRPLNVNLTPRYRPKATIYDLKDYRAMPIVAVDLYE